MKSSIHSLSIISLCIVKALAQQDEQNPDIVLTPSISLVPITADVSPPIASAPLPHYTGPECVPGTESSIISLEAVTYPGTTITGTADNGETVYAGVAGVTYEATVLTIPPCDTGNVSIPVITTSIPVTQNTTIVIPTTPANTTTTTPTTATTPTGISNSTIITSLIPTTATITSSIHFNSTVTSSDDHGGPITTTVTVCDEEDVCQTTVITHTPEPTDDGGPITTTVTVCDEEDVCQTTVITHTPEPTGEETATATVTTTQPTSEPTETETSIQQGGAAQLVQVSSAMNFALIICAFFF